MESRLDGVASDLRAARAPRRHRAHDDRHRARYRREAPGRASPRNLASRPAAAPARGRSGQASGFECAKTPGARPASSAPAAVSRACRLQRRPGRLASRNAVDTRGHARALAGGNAADAPALPASPARLVGRASSSRSAADAFPHRRAQAPQSPRDRAGTHRRNAPHQGRHRRGMASARQLETCGRSSWTSSST